MKKTSASIILALVLDLLFGLLFMFFIISIQKDKIEITYYMNQIGIYKEKTNADNNIHELNEMNIHGYTYFNDGLYIVVTSITMNKDECLKEQDILKKNQIKFIFKEITTSNNMIINEIKNKNFNKVMELMSK